LYESLVFGERLDQESAQRWKRYRIMKEMGWNYQEYQRAPHSLIVELLAFMNTEAKAMKDQMKDGR